MPMTRPATRRGFCLPQRRMPSPLASIEAERAYAPPFAGDVIVKHVLSQLHPGQRSGGIVATRQSPPRSLISAGSDTAKTRWQVRQ